MAWWVVLIIIFVPILLFLVIWKVLSKTHKDKSTVEQRRVPKTASNVKQKAYKKYSEVLNDLKATGYCFVNEQFLLTIYTSDELRDNKFINRPFVCLQTPVLQKQRKAIVIPQVTNHKEHYYDDNMYLNHDKHYLAVGKILFVETKNLNFKSNNWNETNGYLVEINARINEVKQFIKDYLWNNNILCQ